MKRKHARRAKRKARSYKPGMFSAREEEANDYESPDAALAGAADRIGAQWYIRRGDHIEVFMRSPDGYLSAQLFKKGGWYHWPLNWPAQVQNLPAGAKLLPGVERRGAAEDNDDDDFAKRECVMHDPHYGQCGCPPQNRVPKGTTEEDLRAAHELVLFAENTGALYPAKKDVLRELRNLQVTNRYNGDTAWKIWLRWVKTAVGMYNDDVAERTFSPRAMEIAAKTIAWQQAIPLWRGEYDEVVWKQPAGSVANEDGGYQDNPRGQRCGPDAHSGAWRHRGGCCPGRPTCRVQRREEGLCHCEAYHYPHRSGSGRCTQGPEGAARMDRFVHGPPPENDANESGEPDTDWAVEWINPTTKKRQIYLDDLSRRQAEIEARTLRMHHPNADVRAVRRGFQTREAREQEEPAGEAAAVPWVKLERDPERYRRQMDRAKAIGDVASARAIYDMLAPALAKEDQEVFLVVAIDARKQCRDVVEVHRGGQSRVAVEIPVIMRAANAIGGEMFVVVHNHPTGNAKPSSADRRLTKAIEKAARTNELVFMDHVVVGLDQYFSFADEALVKVPRPQAARA